MAIVIGLDQHRVQITAEWIDTDTGELGRARISPALRGDVRRFFKRFAGQPLEVALEATTGWRFVVEELRRVGAVVHLAEPAETSARRGTKKRAKSDRADARHLRELVMVGRLPEAWIPPAHLLDLRARVRLRHTLVDQRGEWQQRIQAVLYHHGVARRRDLLTAERRRWLEDLDLRRPGCRAQPAKPAPSYSMSSRAVGTGRQSRCGTSGTARPQRWKPNRAGAPERRRLRYAVTPPGGRG